MRFPFGYVSKRLPSKSDFGYAIHIKERFNNGKISTGLYGPAGYVDHLGYSQYGGADFATVYKDKDTAFRVRNEFHQTDRYDLMSKTDFTVRQFDPNKIKFLQRENYKVQNLVRDKLFHQLRNSKVVNIEDLRQFTPF